MTVSNFKTLIYHKDTCSVSVQVIPILCHFDSKTVKVGNDQDMAQSERNSYLKNLKGVKTKLDNQVLTVRYYIASRVSICFPIGGHLFT